MTRRMMIICQGPGCHEIVSVDDRYCLIHKRSPAPPVTSGVDETVQETKQRTDEQRARHRLYDRKWQRRRIKQLQDSPWCAHCLEHGVYTPATDVHHVIPHRGDRSMFETSPLESLCHSCHSRHTATEDTPQSEKFARGVSSAGVLLREKNSPIETVN